MVTYSKFVLSDQITAFLEICDGDIGYILSLIPKVLKETKNKACYLAPTGKMLYLKEWCVFQTFLSCLH